MSCLVIEYIVGPENMFKGTVRFTSPRLYIGSIL